MFAPTCFDPLGPSSGSLLLYSTVQFDNIKMHGTVQQSQTRSSFPSSYKQSSFHHPSWHCPGFHSLFMHPFIKHTKC